MSKVENLVIKNLLLDEEYVRKAMPFIKAEYFSELLEKNLYNVINKYFTEYNALPTKEALEIEVGQLGNISDEQHRQTIQYIRDIDDEKSFGDTAKLFEAINNDEFKTKLEDTIKDMNNLLKTYNFIHFFNFI